MIKYMKLFAVIGICLGSSAGSAEEASVATNPITAINIALDPDTMMSRHAEAANARLLQDYPKGFAFDASHQPHITLLQRYVLTKNLDNIYNAIGKVLASEEIVNWKLKASHYTYTPWQNMAIGILAVEPTAALLHMQQKLIDAITPFTVKNGTAEAFFITADDPYINPTTLDYVAAFVPNQTGSNFHPHVTLGIASEESLKKMIAEPFEAFAFSPAGVSVYQLGNFGTARKKLKEWKAMP